MKIVVAEPTGLCFGVTRAIKTMEEALTSQGKIFCIGSPIHNPQEVKRLESLGLVVVDNDDHVPAGEAVFVRAHGISPDVHRRLVEKSVTIIDGNLPIRQEGAEDGQSSYPERDIFCWSSETKTIPKFRAYWAT